MAHQREEFDRRQFNTNLMKMLGGAAVAGAMPKGLDRIVKPTKEEVAKYGSLVHGDYGNFNKYPVGATVEELKQLEEWNKFWFLYDSGEIVQLSDRGSKPPDKNVKGVSSEGDRYRNITNQGRTKQAVGDYNTVLVSKNNQYYDIISKYIQTNLHDGNALNETTVSFIDNFLNDDGKALLDKINRLSEEEQKKLVESLLMNKDYFLNQEGQSIYQYFDTREKSVIRDFENVQNFLGEMGHGLGFNLLEKIPDKDELYSKILINRERENYLVTAIDSDGLFLGSEWVDSVPESVLEDDDFRLFFDYDNNEDFSLEKIVEGKKWVAGDDFNRQFYQIPPRGDNALRFTNDKINGRDRTLWFESPYRLEHVLDFGELTYFMWVDENSDMDNFKQAYADFHIDGGEGWNSSIMTQIGFLNNIDQDPFIFFQYNNTNITGSQIFEPLLLNAKPGRWYKFKLGIAPSKDGFEVYGSVNNGEEFRQYPEDSPEVLARTELSMYMKRRGIPIAKHTTEPGDATIIVTGVRANQRPEDLEWLLAQKEFISRIEAGRRR